MSKKIILFSLIITILFCLATVSLAYAQGSIIDPTTAQYYEGDYTLTDIIGIAIGASRWVLGIVGSLTLIMFIYGGFTFLISGGSSDKVGEAKKIITAAVVGLIIVFSSYLIIAFVIGSLGLGWNGEQVTPAKGGAAASSGKSKAQCEIDYNKTWSCVETKGTGRADCVSDYCPKFVSETILCCPPLK